MRIIIQGIGPVGGFGAGVSDLSDLLAGTKVASPEIARIEKDGKTQELQVFKAKSSAVEEFIPRKKLRRIDRFSRLALLGASYAIADAGFKKGELEDTGIIVATGYGASETTFSFLDSFLDKGDSLSMPTHFSNSVHNAAAAHISILLGIKGPCLTVSQFDLSVTSAFLTAISWLLEERVESVLVGGVDEYTNVLGYATCGFNSTSKPPVIAGEGGCFFLLSREGFGNGRGYGTLTKATIFDPSKEPISFNNHSVLMGERGYGAKILPQFESPFFSYGDLYGHFPAAAAIDIGVGCLSLRNKKMFKSPQVVESDNLMLSKTPGAIVCLKPGNDHLWGAVTLKSNQDIF